MKNIIVIISIMISTIKVQCQNNAIFNGGNNDGWTLSEYHQPINNIFNGGIGDGWAKGIYTQQTNNIFNGGFGDGWANDTSSVGLIGSVGVIENNFGSMVVAYPNPSSGQLNIELGKFYQNIILEVYNVTGQKVFSNQYEQTSLIMFDVEGVKGIYIVRLIAENRTTTIRIVKK
jgi:hypothetical protein